MAISGADWLPDGWSAVRLLLMLSVAKLISSSLTIGSGGSAGDFAPSLAIGGLFGGAFGRAASLLLDDPSIQPGAFALVGMGVFYGGIAHVPLSALVLVCELAGNYDLLVPLMLSQGIAFVALRRRTLYQSQLPTQQDSPVYRDALLRDALRSIRVSDLHMQDRAFVQFTKKTTVVEMMRCFKAAEDQDVFPVVNDERRLVGLIDPQMIRLLATQSEDASWALAVDVMLPVVALKLNDDLRTASRRFLDNGLREIPVIDDESRIVGFLDERELAAVYLRADARADASSSTSVLPVPPARG